MHIAGEHGTVRLLGTLVDHAGSRPYDKVFKVLEQKGSWRLDWNGSPVT